MVDILEKVQEVDPGILKNPSARRITALERSISKKVGRAVADYGMIKDGDRILVAVSGGKDSLTLLKVLSDRKAFVPIRYDVLALHVDMGYKCANKEVLKEFLHKRGYSFHFKTLDIFKGNQGLKITCFWCSWNRRKALFEAAKEYGCSKIALGHHKDDIVQTILMNLLFEGEISAMAPYQELFGGESAIIRPLAYVEEKDIEELARQYDFPVPHCACPNAKTSKRRAIKKFIAEIEEISPGVKSNIFRSLQRIKKDYLV